MAYPRPGIWPALAEKQNNRMEHMTLPPNIGKRKTASGYVWRFA
jgi:hypothetical protein